MSLPLSTGGGTIPGQTCDNTCKRTVMQPKRKSVKMYSVAVVKGVYIMCNYSMSGHNFKVISLLSHVTCYHATLWCVGYVPSVWCVTSLVIIVCSRLFFKMKVFL